MVGGLADACPSSTVTVTVSCLTRMEFRTLPKQLSGLEKDNLAQAWVDPGLPV
jgi:hypothetical protein